MSERPVGDRVGRNDGRRVSRQRGGVIDDGTHRERRGIEHDERPKDERDPVFGRLAQRRAVARTKR
jgi:hypothetical protein